MNILNLILALILFALPIYVAVSANASHGLRICGHKWNSSFTFFFLTYSIFTALIFLGRLSLLKYAYWGIVLLLIIWNRKKIPPISAPLWVYAVFMVGAIASAIFSPTKYRALMMLIKYAFPLLYCWLGYLAVDSDKGLRQFFVLTTIALCLWTALLGGITYVTFPAFVYDMQPEVDKPVLMFAQLCDYCAVLFAVPLAMFLRTRRAPWIWAVLWIAMSLLLYNVRTSIGAAFVAMAIVSLLIGGRRMWYIVLGTVVALCLTVYFVPYFHNKMFVDITGELPINLTYRNLIWEQVLTQFYLPSPIFGSGLGVASEWLKHNMPWDLVHSDYVQMLCEQGIVGILLYAAFIITTLGYTAWLACKAKNTSVGLVAAVCCASFAALFVTMFTENAISYGMQCYAIPFIFLGILMRFKEKEMAA